MDFVVFLPVSYIVYMVRCSDGSLYTGITTDFLRRVRQHNGKERGGAKYTSSRRPVKPAYWLSCATRSDAAKREARLKKMTKAEKEKWAWG